MKRITLEIFILVFLILGIDLQTRTLNGTVLHRPMVNQKFKKPTSPTVQQKMGLPKNFPRQRSTILKPTRTSSDLSIERLYILGCKIHVLIRNRGRGALAQEDYSSGKLVIELKFMTGMRKKSTFFMKNVDPRGVLKRRGSMLNFDTKLFLLQRAEVKAYLKGLRRDAKNRGKKILSQILTPPKICTSRTSRMTFGFQRNRRRTGKSGERKKVKSAFLKRIGYREATGVNFIAVSRTGIGYRGVTGINFTAVPRTGTGWREAMDVNFTAVSRTGTGYREATGVDFTAVSRTGTGYREATGIDFTAVSSTGVGYREASGINFSAVPRTGTGYREATGVDFAAISSTGTGNREATGVNFTAIPSTGTGYREITDVDFTAVPKTGTGYREVMGVNFTAFPRTGTGFREVTNVNFTAIPRTGTGYREAVRVDFTAVQR